MAAAPERLISSPALGRTEKEYQIAGGSVEAVGEKDLVRRLFEDDKIRSVAAKKESLIERTEPKRKSIWAAPDSEIDEVDRII